ncbi:MAG: methylated-DNA--[protein]-cysteine S-methyltransferase [Actinomycetota bacterium]|nr:methylated-DNA--[protein]-cysteine S-methyltransferase [Actinomycetota bacterium]
MTATSDVTGFALFDTAIGYCAIAWTEAGISDVRLPEESVQHTRQALVQRYGQAAEAEPPAEVETVIAGIVALLAGQPVDLTEVLLDPAGVPEFNRRVYQVTQSIRPGSTLCYGDIAVRIGVPGSARAVGRALGENPYPILVPCHRVLAADGSMHGFSAPGGIATKRRMLQIEGALAADEPTLF